MFVSKIEIQKIISLNFDSETSEFLHYLRLNHLFELKFEVGLRIET